MTRIIAALVAVGVAGLFGSIVTNQAQEAEVKTVETKPIERKVIVIEKDGEVEVIEIENGEEVKRKKSKAARVAEIETEILRREDARRADKPMSGLDRKAVEEAMRRLRDADRSRADAEMRARYARGLAMPQRGAAGMWKLENSGDGMILLNTATGQTFLLVGEDEDLHWRPIPMPGAKPRIEFRRDREEERRDEREEMEDMIDHLEDQIDDIEGTIEDLEHELEEAEDDDNDDAVKELRKEIKNLQKKEKKLRKELDKLED